MKTIYLSGPDLNAIDNIIAFEEASTYYTRMGFRVINPHDINMAIRVFYEFKGLPEPTEKEYLSKGIKLLLLEAEVIALLPNWEKSQRANIELFIGSQYNIPVIEAYTINRLNVSSQIDVSFLKTDFAPLWEPETKNLEHKGLEQWTGQQ